MLKRIICLAVLLFGPTVGFAAKEWYTTVDIRDNYWKTWNAARHTQHPLRPDAGTYTLADLEKMVRVLKELGISRLYWIYVFTDGEGQADVLDETGGRVGGAALLKYMADTCRKHGLEFFITLKPFENGHVAAMPPQFVFPEMKPTLRRIAGYSTVDRFTAAHPEMRIKRRPSTMSDPTVRTVKLVNSGNRRITLGKENFRIFSGPENGEYTLYTGDFDYRTALEKRDGREVSVAIFDNLDVPAGHRYWVIVCDRKNDEPELFNSFRRILEAYNPAGEKLETAMAYNRASRNGVTESIRLRFLALSPGRTAPPEKYFPPEDYGKKPETSSFRYDYSSSIPTKYLDGAKGSLPGFVAFHIGRDEYLGSLHPIYPEVRNYWLERIAELCATGADGFDIRISNHSSWTIDGYDYGFNPPVVSEYKRRYGVDIEKEPFDRVRWQELQGQAFTAFMREASRLARRHKMRFHTHISLPMLEPDFWTLNDAPVNFRWEWKKWVDEGLLDGVSFKYIPFPFGAKSGAGMEYIDLIARRAKHLELSAEGRLFWWIQPAAPGGKQPKEGELEALGGRLEKLLSHPKLKAVNLYEVGDYFMIDGHGNPVVPDAFRKTIQQAGEKAGK